MNPAVPLTIFYGLCLMNFLFFTGKYALKSDCHVSDYLQLSGKEMTDS